MYKTGELVAQRIESYCRTWRLWIENAEGVISGDSIMSADSSMQATSLSDDIELGAVCSQSWNMTISDTETAFLGKEYDTYLYLVDYETSGILAGEKIPMGRFTCVKSKKSGGSVQLTMADRLYFPTNHMCRISLCQTGIDPLKTTYADNWACKTAMTIHGCGCCVIRTADG